MCHSEFAWPEREGERGMSSVRAEPLHDPVSGPFRVPRIGGETVQISRGQARRLNGDAPLLGGTWKQEHISDSIQITHLRCGRDAIRPVPPRALTGAHEVPGDVGGGGASCSG